MARHRKMKIVDDEHIFTEEDVLSLNFTEERIRRYCETPEGTVEFFAKLKIIRNSMTCNLCFSEMSLVSKKRKQSPFIWNCKLPCRKSFSVLHNSFFSSSNLNLTKILSIIFKYFKSEEIQEISEEFGVNRKTLGGLFDYIREIIANNIAAEEIQLGGIDENGNPRIVEIDESVFFKRKYNRGRLTNEQWFIGGIERGTRKCFIVPVPNRNAQTIIEILRRFILPGTFVVTDGWRAYRRAIEESNLDLEHGVVNHSLNFVDPDDPRVHTQNVEGLWSRSKYFVKKKKGLSNEQKSLLLTQFLWEYKIEKRKRLNYFILLLNFNNF